MQTESITLETADGELPVYVARPDAEPARAVLVFQEAFGVNDHIRDVTRRFASLGYLAAAPAVFHRTAGDDRFSYGDFEAIGPHMAAMTDAQTLADADATLAWLGAAGVDADAIGAVGFCLGGRMTFLVAASRALGAAVTFYGGGIVNGRSDGMPSLMPRVGSLRTPWLGLFGEQDRQISVEEIEQLRTALEGAPGETEIVRFPGAGHGFHCDARPAAYDAAAATEAWRRATAWLDAHLARPAG